MIDPIAEIQELRAEIESLKFVAREMTITIKLLADKDDRAREFLARIEDILDKS